MKYKSILVLVSTILIMLLMSCTEDCNTEPENESPTCKITLSTGDSVYFSLYDTFSVQVSAEDEDGFVTQVRYYVDGTGLEVDDFEPYDYTVQCYKFESGKHTFKALSLDNDGDTSEDSFEFIIDSYPVAYFTVSAAYAAKNTEIFFDASASTDVVDNDSLLLARWDFNGDSFFDTDWSIDKTTSFIYSESGKFTPVLEIKDSYGFVSRYSLQLIIAENLFGSNITTITVPSGSFQMGDDSYSDCPIISVTLTNDYELGKYEVTNKEYCSMLNYALSKGGILILLHHGMFDLLSAPGKVYMTWMTYCQEYILTASIKFNRA